MRLTVGSTAAENVVKFCLAQFASFDGNANFFESNYRGKLW
jgi:hypothetical protein